jgi:hypothetical protein
MTKMPNLQAATYRRGHTRSTAFAVCGDLWQWAKGSDLDLRLSRKLGKQIELSVVGNNLFQPHHAEFAGDP